MDQRWIDAAQGGHVDALYELLKSDHTIFQTIDKFPLSNTPLHVAVQARQTRFAKEIAILKPGFCAKLDEDGFSPMHLAAATGQVELVKEFLSLVPEVYGVRGREKKTPLHCVVIAGNIEVINLLLDSKTRVHGLLDQTTRNETVFHLAVKNNQLEALKVLLEWLELLHELEVNSNAIRLMEKNHHLEGVKSQISNTKLLNGLDILAKIRSFVFSSDEIQDFVMFREHLKKITGNNPLNWKDDEGNTVLHIVTFNRQIEIIEVLLGAKTSGSEARVDVNALNRNNLTALDILLQLPGGKHNDSIESMLRAAGAVTSAEIVDVSEPSTTITLRRKFPFKGHHSVSEARKTSLLLAIIVGMTCFYVGIYPPGGVWQYEHGIEQSNSTISHRPGTAVLGERGYLFIPFMHFDTAGFFLPLLLIGSLARGSPVPLLVLICLFVIFGVYVVSVVSILPIYYLPDFGIILLTWGAGLLAYCIKKCWLRSRNAMKKAGKEEKVQDEESAAMLVTHKPIAHRQC